MNQEQRILLYLKENEAKAFTAQEIHEALFLDDGVEACPITSTRRNLCALREKELINRSREREVNSQGPYRWRFRKPIKWF